MHHRGYNATPVHTNSGPGHIAVRPHAEAVTLSMRMNCCTIRTAVRVIWSGVVSPHDACFIHDSCFCEGSGSFPPVKPQRPSWAQFSYDWYCELAASLALHPHSPLPRFGSEVKPDVLI